jgi:hypothetical protein
MLTEADALEGLHEWVLSLPWVVERAPNPTEPDVRYFGVDCEPLGQRRIWLVTGIDGEDDWGGTGMAVVLPRAESAAVEDDGERHGVVPLRAGHVLVSVARPQANQPRQVERLLLSAYDHAMSAPNTTEPF